jgi:hypothetical protein
MVRLTELKVPALVRENKPAVDAVGDGSGLCLRITNSGASWQLRYRHAAESVYEPNYETGQTLTFPQPEPGLLLTNHYILWYPTGVPSFSV